MQVYETCCTYTAHCKYRTQKSPKIRHLRTIVQLCRAIFSQLRHVSMIGKKLVYSCNHSHAIYMTDLHNVNNLVRPTQYWNYVVNKSIPFNRIVSCRISAEHNCCRKAIAGMLTRDVISIYSAMTSNCHVSSIITDRWHCWIECRA